MTMPIGPQPFVPKNQPDQQAQPKPSAGGGEEVAILTDLEGFKFGPPQSAQISGSDPYLTVPVRNNQNKVITQKSFGPGTAEVHHGGNAYVRQPGGGWSSKTQPRDPNQFTVPVWVSPPTNLIG